jgi:hypothetical protein
MKKYSFPLIAVLTILFSCSQQPGASNISQDKMQSEHKDTLSYPGGSSKSDIGKIGQVTEMKGQRKMASIRFLYPKTI